jgi:hypothetical protein
MGEGYDQNLRFPEQWQCAGSRRIKPMARDRYWFFVLSCCGCQPMCVVHSCLCLDVRVWMLGLMVWLEKTFFPLQ